ncbi:MAG: alpha-amylase family protein [Planctomycetota bacterium]
MNDRPDWTDPGNMRWAWWGIEPCSAYRRIGHKVGAVIGGAHWLDDWYNRIHSEDTVRRMADIGVTCAITYFYKGFGLRYEKPEMKRAKKLVDVCHKYGIRVFGYTQFGSIYPETFYDEVPAAKEWIQIDENGVQRTWGGCYYRLFPCFNKNEFVSYVKRCMEYGVETVGLDGFHFDNSYSAPCYCRTCLCRFRAYLAGKFQDPRERFGIPSFKHTRIPPTETITTGSIQDPVAQEWVRFRVEGLANVVSELRDHARALRSDVAVLFNPAFPRLDNAAAEKSVSPWHFGRQADLLWAENRNFPRIDDKGRVIHQVSAFKLGQAAGYGVMSTTWLGIGERDGLPSDARQVALIMAESAAFGGVAGTNWALRPADRGRAFRIDEGSLQKSLAEYFHFMEKHKHLYFKTRTSAQVALLYSSSSITFNHAESHPAYISMEQLLLQRHIPYDVVFDEDIEKILGYSILILPHVVCLSDNQIERIRQFVRDGGAIFIVGNCGECDENFRERRVGGFDGIAETRVIRHPGFLAGVKVDEGKVSLHPHAEKIARMIERLLGDRMDVHIQAPETVMADFRKSESGLMTAHFVNYRNETSAKGIKITLRRECMKAHFLSPEVAGKRELSVRLEKSGYKVMIPPFQTYGVAVLTMKSGS